MLSTHDCRTARGLTNLPAYTVKADGCLIIDSGPSLSCRTEFSSAAIPMLLRFTLPACSELLSLSLDLEEECFPRALRASRKIELEIDKSRSYFLTFAFAEYSAFLNIVICERAAFSLADVLKTFISARAENRCASSILRISCERLSICDRIQVKLHKSKIDRSSVSTLKSRSKL